MVFLQQLMVFLQHLIAGQPHLLLIGNQGVGKNKLADQLLSLMRKEREYIQLHRDVRILSMLFIHLCIQSELDMITFVDDSAEFNLGSVINKRKNDMGRFPSH